MSTHVVNEVADPLLQAWQVAWGGHALTAQPLEYFQANIFYPLPNSLAFSDALVGYAPAGLVGSGFEAALVRYNALFLFAYALAFCGAYLLARELGLGRGAAAVAGAAFAYAPWRLEQATHLHVISSGGIPLTAFLAIRGYRRRHAPTIVAAWGVATWQLSIGFTLGVPLAYGVALAGCVVVVVWLRSGRPPIERSVVLATAIGAVVFAAVAVVLARPYLTVLHTMPEARRTFAEVFGFSPPPRSFIVAPQSNGLWGGVTAGLRASLPWSPEQTLFPGAVIAGLAAVGLTLGPWSRGVKVGVAAAIAVLVSLSLGLRVAHGWTGYRLLFELAPGWDGLRTPGRLNTFTSLALALAAAAGAETVLARVRAGGVERWRAHVAGLAAAALALVVVAEGSARPGATPIKRVAPPPAGLSQARSPQLNLPLAQPGDFGDTSAFSYVLWSVDGFPRIVNGTSGFVTNFGRRVLPIMEAFPDRRSVRFLRALGVRSVVLNTRAAQGTAWAGWATWRYGRLGLRARRVGDVVIYDVGRRTQISASALRQILR